MRFGTGYWSGAATRLRPRHHALLHDELCDDAQLAEALGYDDYWLVEHHFWYDGHCSAQLTALGAAAAVTERIGLGTSVLLLPLHDPLRVAEMAATVDVLSGGRLRLVFGLGYRDEEYDGFGISRRVRGERMEESLSFLDRLWPEGAVGEPVEQRGRHIAYRTAVSCRPAPVRRPTLYLGGFAPQVAARAARYGCGLQLAPGMTPGYYRSIIDAFHAAGREAGRDTASAEIGVCRDVWVAPTNEEARRVAGPHLLHYYGETGALGWKLFRDREGELIGPDRAGLLAKLVRGTAAAAIVGDPDTVAEEIARLESVGFTYVQLRFRFGSLEFPAIRDSMTLFATEVMPRFRATAPKEEPTPCP